ncbi:MAG: hypothetical protein AAGU74_01790 [Bacillota bacterium]
MKTPRAKRILSILAAVLALIALALIVFHEPVLETVTGPHMGTIQIIVVDGFSDLPLEGASVVIPELDQTFATNAEGKTPMIDIPILQDEHYNTILSQPWGRITVLVYSEGYLPHALFYVMIWENQTRLGPTIYMFPEGSSYENQPFIVVEAPHRLWASELIEKYRPQ